MSTTPLISSVLELSSFLSSILPSNILYLDLEGRELSRHGTISLITILVHPLDTVRIVDVSALGKLAFSTPSDSGKTLKSILEDPNVPKYFWDVRNDADALWALYSVGLAGVTDIQLLENASRVDDKTYVRGLDKCVQYDLKPGSMQLNRWTRTKKEIRSLMAADVFSKRPLEENTVQYCINDVLHLPGLHTLYLGRITPEWLSKARRESELRVVQAHTSDYKPHSPSKTLSPWSKESERVMTTDEMLEDREERAMDDLQAEMLRLNDDVGYYDDDDWDDDNVNAADGAFCPEALDSCWDNSG